MSKTAPPPTVTYNRERSTKWHAVYDAQSRTHAHVTYRVVYAEDTAAWSCQCPAASFGNHCAHIHAAQRVQCQRQHRALWASLDRAALVAAERDYALRAASGILERDEEMRIAYDTLGDEIARRMAEGVAA